MVVFFFSYLLKVSLGLGLLYGFYRLALHRLTFYTAIRWYFLLGTSLALLLPLVDVLPFLAQREAADLPVVRAIPTWDSLAAPVLYTMRAPAASDTAWQVLAVLFNLGLLGQGGRRLLALWSFYRLRRTATCWQQDGLQICQVDKAIAPFSFGQAVFLNKNLLAPEELQAIIRHERVHVQQQHTLDVLWLECLCLLNWFNPLVWLLRGAVRQNLEFIADQQVLQQAGIDKKYYQYLLLKVIGLPDLSIANPFNISSLKTRIMMMNRKPSPRPELAWFLFAVPLTAILLLAFRSPADSRGANPALWRDPASLLGLAARPDTVPPPPPPPPPAPPVPGKAAPVQEAFNYQDFFKAHPGVKTLNWENNTVVLELKSGQVERYNLKNNRERARLEARYGKLPLGPPPPPPPPMIVK